jgi:PAS domain S-box-containing protein
MNNQDKSRNTPSSSGYPGESGLSSSLVPRELYQKLELNEITYQLLFETAQDAIFLIRDYLFLECNSKALEMFGCDRTDIIGKSPIDFSPPFQSDGRESAMKAMEKIDAAIAGENQFFEWKHLMKDGTPIDVEVSLNCLTSSGTIHLQAIVRDISERKKSDEQLRKFSECLLSFTADPQYNINLLTMLCGEILGATCSLYNRLQGGLLCTAGRWNSPDDYIVEDKPDGHICYDVIKNNGKEVFTVQNLPQTPYFITDPNVAKYQLISYAGKIVRCGGKPVGSLCAVFQQDYYPDTHDQYFISLIASAIGVEEERKKAQDEIVRYAAEMQELNRAKDKFFSIISHDLKGPFNAILGFSDILTTEWGDYSDDERQHFIRNIHSSAKNTFRLLENLLEWAMTQTGKLTFSPIQFDLSVIANDVVILMRDQAEKKQIKLFTAVNFNTMVLADENMIRTIIRNLVSNAIKYTQAGGQVKILSDEIAPAAGNPGLIKICISDTGIGIDKDSLPKLFRIDEKIRSSGTAQEKGTGLGLILCKELIIKNGGTIWAESEPGQGSRFCFTVPQA